MYDKKKVLELNFTGRKDISEEELKEYIYDLCNYEDLLDKRVNNAFRRNKLLYQTMSKEDLKQNIYLRLLKDMLFVLPFKDKLDKIKLLNSVITNEIRNSTRNLYRDTLLPLNDKMIINSPYIQNKSDIENIMLLFAEQSIEREIVEMLANGYTNESIIDMLDIGERTFYRYKKIIKDTLKKEGYKNENN
ncbi:MAG: hypothetical protein JXR51_12635 [Bacteroidales bacterium]|nr:hypothetical protein [Bacteroidales bacterium]